MNVYPSADRMFHDMVFTCYNATPKESRMGKQQEVNAWTGTLLNPRCRRVTDPVRNLRPGYPQASLAWNLAERNDVESICWWNPNGRRISDDGSTFYGANYGMRFMPYLEEAMLLIHGDQATRRAWVPIWLPTDLVNLDDEMLTAEFEQDRTRYSRSGKDVPCTVGFGLSVNDGQLDMHVVMRSQSAWGVFPYDIHLMTALQELIANELTLDLGHMMWTCISLHIYEREHAIIKEFLTNWQPESAKGLDDPIELTLSEARQKYPHVFQMLMDGHPIDTYGLGLERDPVVLQMIEGAAQIRSEST